MFVPGGEVEQVGVRKRVLQRSERWEGRLKEPILGNPYVSLETEKSIHTWISMGTNEGMTRPGQSTRRTSEVQKSV